MLFSLESTLPQAKQYPAYSQIHHKESTPHNPKSIRNYQARGLPIKRKPQSNRHTLEKENPASTHFCFLLSFPRKRESSHVLERMTPADRRPYLVPMLCVGTPASALQRGHPSNTDGFAEGSVMSDYARRNYAGPTCEYQFGRRPPIRPRPPIQPKQPPPAVRS